MIKPSFREILQFHDWLVTEFPKAVSKSQSNMWEIETTNVSGPLQGVLWINKAQGQTIDDYIEIINTALQQYRGIYKVEIHSLDDDIYAKIGVLHNSSLIQRMCTINILKELTFSIESKENHEKRCVSLVVNIAHPNGENKDIILHKSENIAEEQWDNEKDVIQKVSSIFKLLLSHAISVNLMTNCNDEKVKKVFGNLLNEDTKKRTKEIFDKNTLVKNILYIKGTHIINHFARYLNFSEKCNIENKNQPMLALEKGLLLFDGSFKIEEDYLIRSYIIPFEKRIQICSFDRDTKEIKELSDNEIIKIKYLYAL